MKFKTLILENFLSFKNLELDLNGVSVINGENLTEDSQESNGSGKSAIFSAIEAVLFNSTQREGVSVKDLVMWGEKSSYVSLSIYCPSRQEEMLIERVIGKGAKLSISINSEQANFSTTNDGNDFIINWLGLSRDDFLNYYLVGKAKYTSFYTSSNKVKLDMISRFSNLSVLDSSDEVVTKSIEEKEEDLNLISASLYKNEGIVERINLEIDAEKNRDFGLERENKLSTIKSRIFTFESAISLGKESIEANNSLIASNTNKIAEELNQIKLLGIEMKKVDVPNFDEAIAEIDAECSSVEGDKKKDADLLESLTKDLNGLSSDIQKAKLNVSGSITCPKCNHNFNPSVDKNIEFEIKFIDDATKVVEQVSTNIEKLNKSIKNRSGEINELHKEKSELYLSIEKANQAIKQISTSISDAESRIRQADSTIERKENSNKSILSDEEYKLKQILDLKKEMVELQVGSVDAEKISNWETEIENIRLNVKHLKGEKESVDEEIKKLNIWKHNLKMFRSELSTEVLDVITAYTNKELNGFKTDLQIKWEGFKVLGNGSLSDKITPTIIRNGEDKKFGSFSGGERAKLEYASILANQYIINSTHPHGGLDFLMTDEITEGLDGMGLDLLVKALVKTNKTILLITHVTNRSLECNQITVVKEFGVSRIQ